MVKFAWTFPGQGSQFVTMGRDLFEEFSVARDVVAQVNDALGEDLGSTMFDGPEDQLKLTKNTQPALFTHSMMVVKVLESVFGVQASDHADFFVGHSLGEYSALCAAGCFPIDVGARLLRLRGEAMQNAVAVGEGAMIALLGVSFDDATDIVNELKKDGIIALANDNAPGQAVLSGEALIIDKAIEIAKKKGAKKAVLLPVSAPFHSALMAPAAEEMREALAEIEFAKPSAPIVPNVLAKPEHDPGKLRDLLVEQVTGTVRWRESIAQLVQEEAVDHLIELGSGKVLTGLAKRIDRSATAINVATVDQMTQIADMVM